MGNFNSKLLLSRRVCTQQGWDDELMKQLGLGRFTRNTLWVGHDMT
jgi:hypothetical protein